MFGSVVLIVLALVTFDFQCKEADTGAVQMYESTIKWRHPSCSSLSFLQWPFVSFSSVIVKNVTVTVEHLAFPSPGLKRGICN